MSQPPPTPNDHVSVQSLVRGDLLEREQHGIRTYGTPLQPFNGRDAAQDAYEEALDLSCYLRQLLLERGKVYRLPMPGPEVTKVWTSHGSVWERGYAATRPDLWHNTQPGCHDIVSWQQLVAACEWVSTVPPHEVGLDV